MQGSASCAQGVRGEIDGSGRYIQERPERGGRVGTTQGARKPRKDSTVTVFIPLNVDLLPCCFGSNIERHYGTSGEYADSEHCSSTCGLKKDLLLGASPTS